VVPGGKLVGGKGSATSRPADSAIAVAESRLKETIRLRIVAASHTGRGGRLEPREPSPSRRLRVEFGDDFVFRASDKCFPMSIAFRPFWFRFC
jgi:hypothetical protein